MLQLTVTLTVDQLNLKSIGIIYGSWPSIIPKTVNLCEISLKLLSGQDCYLLPRTDEKQKDRRTEGQHAPLHNTTEGPFGCTKVGCERYLLSEKRRINSVYLY